MFPPRKADVWKSSSSSSWSILSFWGERVKILRSRESPIHEMCSLPQSCRWAGVLSQRKLVLCQNLGTSQWFVDKWSRLVNIWSSGYWKTICKRDNECCHEGVSTCVAFGASSLLISFLQCLAFDAGIFLAIGLTREFVRYSSSATVASVPFHFASSTWGEPRSAGRLSFRSLIIISTISMGERISVRNKYSFGSVIKKINVSTRFVSRHLDSDALEIVLFRCRWLFELARNVNRRKMPSYSCHLTLTQNEIKLFSIAAGVICVTLVMSDLTRPENTRNRLCCRAH